MVRKLMFLVMLLASAVAIAQDNTSGPNGSWKWMWPDAATRSLYPNAFSTFMDSKGDIFVSFTFGDTAHPDGLYISRDGGKSFNIAEGLLDRSSLNVVWSACIGDSDDVFAGMDQAIFKSTDAGRTWRLSFYVPGERFLPIVYKGGDTLFAGGGYGIYRSTDNGENWVNVCPNDLSSANRKYYAIGSIVTVGDTVFAGTAYAFLNGAYGILRSTDGGNTWEYANNGIGTHADSVVNTNILSMAVQGNAVFAVSNHLYRSLNGGASWQIVGDSLFYGQESGAIVSSKMGLIVPTLYGLYITPDLGKTWREVVSFAGQLPINVFSGCQYTSDSTVLVGMWNGVGVLTIKDPPKINSQMPETLDSVGVNTPTTFSVSASSPSGSKLSYVWKVNGNVVSTSEKDSLTYTFREITGATTVSVVVSDASGAADSASWSFQVVTGVDEPIHGPATFSLSQNYPNPFNPTTTVRYSVAKRSFVTLSVYNVLGQLVKTLVNEEKSPGVHEVSFDGASLPSGAYFYVLHAGNYTQTKKMLLLK